MRVTRELNIKPDGFELIKILVENNQYYTGNEDLLPEICEEVYYKSYLLFSSVKNSSYLENYLKKIVNNALIDVLKKHSRTKSLSLSLRNKYFSSEDEITNKSGIDLYSSSKSTRHVYDIYKVETPFDENEFFEPSEQVLQKMVQLLQFVNSDNLDKRYMEIFIARYLHNKATKDIALELNLSENEVSRRLINLAGIISDNISY